MPRFGTKTLLIVIAVVALWFSTFAAYAAARDIRASILLSIFVVSGLAAVRSRGATRMFWVGFFAVMLLCGGNDLQRPLNRYVPNFAWLSASPYVPPTLYVAPSASMPGTGGFIDTAVSPPLPISSPIGTSNRRDAISATVAAVWTLALATFVGFIGAYICNQSREPAD